MPGKLQDLSSDPQDPHKKAGHRLVSATQTLEWEHTYKVILRVQWQVSSRFSEKPDLTIM